MTPHRVCVHAHPEWTALRRPGRTQRLRRERLSQLAPPPPARRETWSRDRKHAERDGRLRNIPSARRRPAHQPLASGMVVETSVRMSVMRRHDPARLPTVDLRGPSAPGHMQVLIHHSARDHPARKSYYASESERRAPSPRYRTTSIVVPLRPPLRSARRRCAEHATWRGHARFARGGRQLLFFSPLSVSSIPLEGAALVSRVGQATTPLWPLPVSTTRGACARVARGGRQTISWPLPASTHDSRRYAPWRAGLSNGSSPRFLFGTSHPSLCRSALDGRVGSQSNFLLVRVAFGGTRRDVAAIVRVAVVTLPV